MHCRNGLILLSVEVYHKTTEPRNKRKSILSCFSNLHLHHQTSHIVAFIGINKSCGAVQYAVTQISSKQLASFPFDLVLTLKRIILWLPHRNHQLRTCDSWIYLKGKTCQSLNDNIKLLLLYNMKRYVHILSYLFENRLMIKIIKNLCETVGIQFPHSENHVIYGPFLLEKPHTPLN